MSFNKAECGSCTWVTPAPQSYRLGQEWLRVPGGKGPGVLVHSQLNVSQQCARVAKKANSSLARI